MVGNGEDNEITTITISVDERPLYRVRKPLWYKDSIIQPGSLHRLESLDAGAVKTLTTKGTITAVQPPPLSILPGWLRRSERLAEAGIEDALQMLNANAEDVAGYMRVSLGTVKRWQDEINNWLQAPADRRG